jgi:hypothetical protein
MDDLPLAQAGKTADSSGCSAFGCNPKSKI